MQEVITGLQAEARERQENEWFSALTHYLQVLFAMYFGAHAIYIISVYNIENEHICIQTSDLTPGLSAIHSVAYN